MQPNFWWKGKEEWCGKKKTETEMGTMWRRQNERKKTKGPPTHGGNGKKANAIRGRVREKKQRTQGHQGIKNFTVDELLTRQERKNKASEEP